MIRSYVVTNSFVSFGALMSVLEAAGVGTLNERITIASWFCWARRRVAAETERLEAVALPPPLFRH